VGSTRIDGHNVKVGRLQPAQVGPDRTDNALDTCCGIVAQNHRNIDEQARLAAGVLVME
jgi:hypothetical protein